MGRNKRLALAYLAELARHDAEVFERIARAGQALLHGRPNYILEGKELVEVDYMTWALWFEDACGENISRRKVADTYLGENIWISTVFLGIDHNYRDEGPPLLFETMVFHRCDPPRIGIGGREHEWDGVDEWRYATYAEAEEGHARAVASAEAGNLPPRLDDDPAAPEPAPAPRPELRDDDDEAPPESAKVVH